MAAVFLMLLFAAQKLNTYIRKTKQYPKQRCARIAYTARKSVPGHIPQLLHRCTPHVPCAHLHMFMPRACAWTASERTRTSECIIAIAMYSHARALSLHCAHTCTIPQYLCTYRVSRYNCSILRAHAHSTRPAQGGSRVSARVLLASHIFRL